MTCEECGGCTDDTCRGCSVRWCGGSYMGEGCDRCPNKVPKTITDTKGREREIMVRCNASAGAGHDGICHYDPWKAEREP